MDDTAVFNGPSRLARWLGVPSLVLATAGCGLLDNPADTDSRPVEEGAADAPADVPDRFVREVRLFSTGSANPTAELEIEAVEATEDSTAVYVTLTNTGETVTEGQAETTDPFLFDPVEGVGYLRLQDGDPSATDTEPYGSHTDGNEVPFYSGVANALVFYFPALPDDLDYVTFFGGGTGAMTGIPVDRVDQHRPAAQPGIEGDEGADREPEPGETLVLPVREPDGEAQSYILDTEGYVEGADAALTREGEEETLALSADVLFEFDEAELTGEAAELIADTAESIEANAADDAGTLSITGHTDGVGDDAYNDTLSQDRAEAVAAELESRLSVELDVEVDGRGDAEPVAEEGGADDEEARRLNRRVELTYTATSAGMEEGEEGAGIAAAERHVASPASYRADAGDAVATAEHDGFELAVYPLLRDGATVIAEVELTNTTAAEAQPEVGGEDIRRAASGESLGGFRLRETEPELVRYPLAMQFEGETVPFAEVARSFGPEETYRLAVVFPAPDPDTTELTLAAGPFGEVEVPVE